MLDITDPLVQIGITVVVCTIPAIASTVCRLWIRRGRFWADDAWAFASAISQLLMFTGVFIHIANASPKSTMVAAYYLMAAPFYTVVWFARLSILFSIIRIDPSPTRRRHLLFVAVIFFIVVAVLVAQLWWVCEPAAAAWKDKGSPQCSLTRQVVITQLVTDILADLILIIAPLKLLQGLKDKPLRRRLTLIFSTCLITTAVSLVHAAFIFLHAGPQEVICAIVEDNVSLMVCNIPVVVTSLIAFRREVRMANASKPSGVQFASWGFRHSTGAQPSNAQGGTTTTGWTNSLFRWERNIQDTEIGTTMTTTDLSKTVDLNACIELSELPNKPSTNGVQIDHEVYVEVDETQKNAWRSQDN